MSETIPHVVPSARPPGAPPADRQDVVFPAPPHPLLPDVRLEPFAERMRPPAAHRLPATGITTIEMRAGNVSIHPHLPPVPVWGYALDGTVSVPGPLLEARADRLALVRFDNRLPGSAEPGQMPPALPFLTNVAPDPADGEPDPQNQLGTMGEVAEDLTNVPVGWTSVHLHGGHSRADADGFPDNMAPTGGSQLAAYDNSYDNVDLGLGKVGTLQWYHDHAMNGTRCHVYAGLAAGYVVRDPQEAALGLPTGAHDGEIVAVLQDRNVGLDGDKLRLLHKTTPSTGEFFGPLTLVNGHVWPGMALRPEVYRLRLLNGSNARTYRLHLVSVEAGPDGTPQGVTVHHDRVLVIGTDGGLLWRASAPSATDAFTMAPAERLDLLIDLSGLDGRSLYLINSAPAPFGGQATPDLTELVLHGDPDGKNPYPQVLRLDVDRRAAAPGQPAVLFAELAGRAHRPVTLNPAFRRLVHEPEPAPADAPLELTIDKHQHHVVLLAETDPPGHLYLQELEEAADGAIELQLSPATAAQRYSVVGWPAGDPAPSTSRMSFYDRVGTLARLGEWQVFVFVNTTGDTHPLHIHQSQFQPLGLTADALPDDASYDPVTRTSPKPLAVTLGAGRAYEEYEVHGWKDVIRVDPLNVVKVAIRFDVPGRFVYHCHVLEHEDTDMMRPFVVTVTDPHGMHM